MCRKKGCPKLIYLWTDETRKLKKFTHERCEICSPNQRFLTFIYLVARILSAMSNGRYYTFTKGQLRKFAHTNLNSISSFNETEINFFCKLRALQKLTVSTRIIIIMLMRLVIIILNEIDKSKAQMRETSDTGCINEIFFMDCQNNFIFFTAAESQKVLLRSQRKWVYVKWFEISTRIGSTQLSAKQI